MPLLIAALTVLFLFFSAAFSGSETALFSIPRERLWQYEKSLSRVDRWVFRLLADGQRTLLLILLGNIFVNITIVSLIHSLIQQYYPLHVELMTLVVATLVILAFGEVLPKNIALQNNESVARLVAPLLYGLSTVLGPGLRLVQRLNTLFLRVLGRHLRSPSPFITLEELQSAVDSYAEQGVILPHERDIILSVLQRGSQPVRRLMLHRSEVPSVRADATVAEVLADMRARASTVAVVQGGRAHAAPRGFAYATKLLARPADEPVRDSMAPAEFVPGSMETAEVIALLVQRELRDVIVLDEFGAYTGVFSAAYGMRRLVAPARAVRQARSTEGGMVRVSGQDLVEYLQDLLPQSLLENAGEVRTLNGLLVNYLGYIPKRDQVFAVEDVTFYIIDADQTVVRNVGISKRGRAV